MVGARHLPRGSRVISSLNAALEEQRTAWRAGQRLRAEDALAQRPELAGDPDAVLELALQEFALRRAAGESPAVEEYVRRFPALRQGLLRQLAPSFFAPPTSAPLSPPLPPPTITAPPCP